jgi:hypothetical protein
MTIEEHIDRRTHRVTTLERLGPALRHPNEVNVPRVDEPLDCANRSLNRRVAVDSCAFVEVEAFRATQLRETVLYAFPHRLRAGGIIPSVKLDRGIYTERTYEPSTLGAPLTNLAPPPYGVGG